MSLREEIAEIIYGVGGVPKDTHLPDVEAIISRILAALPKEKEIYGDEINQYIDKGFNEAIKQIKRRLE